MGGVGRRSLGKPYTRGKYSCPMKLFAENELHFALQISFMSHCRKKYRINDFPDLDIDTI